MLNAWHQPVPPFVVKKGQRLDITLWLQGDDLPERVFLRAEPDNEEWLLIMKAHSAEGRWRYQAGLTLNEGEATRRYCFKLVWADRQQWFGPQGWSLIPPGQLAQFALDEPDRSPAWVADQIFYQIFPDRFASSGGEHGIQNGSYRHHAAGCDVVRRDWQHPLEDRDAASTFYGGDLDGIDQKLPYLQKLGVTALYLNPIFTAPSVHKYDTEDYYQVDPYFGGNAALQRLRVSTHKVGMKLVLDGVFNHTGDSHPGLIVTSRATTAPATTRIHRTAAGSISTLTAGRWTGKATPACRSSILPNLRWPRGFIAARVALCATGYAHPTASTVGGWTWCICWVRTAVLPAISNTLPAFIRRLNRKTRRPTCWANILAMRAAGCMPA